MEMDISIITAGEEGNFQETLLSKQLLQIIAINSVLLRHVNNIIFHVSWRFTSSECGIIWICTSTAPDDVALGGGGFR